MYLTAMPGKVPGARGDFSCDANSAAGSLCPEIDVLEANVRAAQSTLHKCDVDGSDTFVNCDQGGSIASTRDIPAGHFDNGGTIVDTAKVFQVSVSFDGNQSSLNKVAITYSQDGRNFTL